MEEEHTAIKKKEEKKKKTKNWSENWKLREKRMCTRKEENESNGHKIWCCEKGKKVKVKKKEWSQNWKNRKKCNVSEA